MNLSLCRINKKQAWDYVEPKYNRDKAQLSPADEERERERQESKQYSFTPKVVLLCLLIRTESPLLFVSSDRY